MPFTHKDWQNAPSTATQLNDVALEDMEDRLAAYADTVSGPIFSAKGYGVKADGKTVTDAAITSAQNTLSSSQAGFTSADAGKAVTVVAAGAPTTTTTTAALTNAVGFTALAVNALPAQILPGGVKITSGANTQWVTTTGAAAGATSIPLIGPSITAIGTALSTGAPITSITVPALQAAVPSGTITLVNVATQGGAINFQTFSTTGAAINATSIPVTSATPNFAYPAGTQIFGSPMSVLANFSYPIGSTVSSPIPSLFGYIGSVSGGVASLVTTPGGGTNLNAGTTISGGEATYGTDDRAAAQACIDAAGSAPGGIALFPYGQICLSGTLSSSATLTIEGLGVEELFGGTDRFNTANMPTIAPYLQGTVFVVMPHDTDAFTLTQLGRAVHTKRFGIRFATSFYRTGDGIDRSPSLAQLGIIGGVLEDVRVFGHDGNHYGDIMDSQELCRNVGFRSYGGGGMWLRTNPLTVVAGPPGNLTVMDQYSITSVGGVAHNFLIDTSASQYLDYCQFMNPEHIVSAPSPAFPNQSPPTSAQQTIQAYYSESKAATSGYLGLGFYGAVCESNVGSKATFPWGKLCFRTNDPIVVMNQPTLTTAPASGTAYINKMGQLKLGIHMFTLGPAATAPNSTTLSAQATAGFTTITVTSATGFAAGQGIQIDTGASSEFAIISSIAGSVLTLIQSSGFGGSITHANGATVTNGAAVIIGQNSSNGSFPGSQKLAWFASAVGSQPSMQTIWLPVPSGWYFQLNYSTNTTRMWTDYTSATG